MNILLNLSDISRKNGGVYQYTLTLLNILKRADQNYHFFIFCTYNNQDLTKICSNASNMKLCVAGRFPNKRGSIFSRGMNKILKYAKVSPSTSQTKSIYDKLVARYKIDIIHTPYQETVYSSDVKTITTQHDVQELHFPEFFTSQERAYRAVHYKNIIDHSDHIIVSYEHIKNDVSKYFEKPKDKISVVLLEMNNLWFKNKKGSVSDILLPYDLAKTFLLYPAATWEHKNHLNLFRALDFVSNKNFQIVCTGNKTDYFMKVIDPFLEVNGLKERVKFLGVVSDDVLYALYQNCRAVIVPTLYEAGSFPLMESILMDIPVICSNVTSLPETLGSMDYVFDPTQPASIAKLMSRIIEDDLFLSDNLKQLAKVKSRLINTNALSKICSIYQELNTA